MKSGKNNTMYFYICTIFFLTATVGYFMILITQNGNIIYQICTVKNATSIIKKEDFGTLRYLPKKNAVFLPSGLGMVCCYRIKLRYSCLLSLQKTEYVTRKRGTENKIHQDGRAGGRGHAPLAAGWWGRDQPGWPLPVLHGGRWRRWGRSRHGGG